MVSTMERMEGVLKNQHESHPANALTRSQEGRSGVPKPAHCPSTGLTYPRENDMENESVSDDARLRNDDESESDDARLKNDDESGSHPANVLTRSQ